MKPNPTNARPARAWPYFALAYGWSWLAYLPAVLSGRPADVPWVAVLRYLAGIGPLVAGVYWTYRTQGRDGRRDFWRRLIDGRRIGLKGSAAILLCAPVLTALAALADRLQGGLGAQPEALARLIAQPWQIAPFMLFALLFGPLPEEIGWRGCALDRLLARHNALAASLILGAAWAGWHLPLFLIPGTYQADLGIGTPAFWLFLAQMVPQTVVMTWLYRQTRRSTLSAVLFHLCVNVVGEWFALSARAELWLFGLWIAAACAVAVGWAANPRTRRAENAPGIKEERCG